MKKLLSLLLLLTVSIVSGQNDTIVGLDEIVLNGIRSTNKTPISNTIISRDSLQTTYQGFEISNIINLTPNIITHNDNGTPFGYTYFRIRGLDQSRINMTLNGIPLNEPEDQGVFFSNFPNFIDNIKSLEIQRGVGTSTNGTSPFAGSINFISQDGLNETLELKGTLGSFNTYRGGVTYQSGLVDNTSVFLNFSSFATDGYKYNSGASGNSIFLTGKHFTNNRDFMISMFAGNAKNEMSWKPTSYSDILKDKKINYTSDDGDDYFKQVFVQVQEIERVNDKTNLTTTVFFNNLNGGYDYLGFDGGSNGNTNLFLTSYFFGLTSNLNYNYNGNKINLGVSGNLYQREHSYTFTDTNTGFKNEFSTFLKYARSLGDFTLYGDIQYRYTDFSYKGDVALEKIEWNFLNPKVGITYSVSENNEVFASVGSSKREPTRTDLFGGNDYLLPDSNIDSTPEQVIDYEIGYKLRGKVFNLNANLFYMDFKDEITLSGGTSPTGVPLSRSVDKSFRTGLEIDLEYKINKMFNIGYTESYMKSEIKNGGETFEPILSPKTIRNIVLRYDYKGFLIEAVSKHQSNSNINLENTESLEKFTIFDSNLGYRNNKFSVILNIQNITDKLYFTNGGMLDRNFEPTNEPHYFIGNPRSFYLTTKIFL